MSEMQCISEHLGFLSKFRCLKTSFQVFTKRTLNDTKLLGCSAICESK